MKLLILLTSLFIFTSTQAKDIGLTNQSEAPNIKTKDIDGKMFDLKNELKKGPIILVFYRGGWCPYCNLQLRSLQNDLVPALKDYKAQMAVISVDKTEKALETRKKENLGMTIISDPQAKILEDYKVVFTVPNELVKKYKNNYKIDLEAASGAQHHKIAIPAVYIIASNGKIHFAYANEDYKVRAQIDDIKKGLNSL